jgi:hypothetical protein
MPWTCFTALHRWTRSSQVHLCSSTGTSTLQICFPTATNRRIIWSLLVNSAAQRRPSHHLHFCSHDDVPNTFGISHVHLVLSHRHVLTQHIAFTSDNHLEFLSLTSWRRPSLCSWLCPKQEPRTLHRGFLSGMWAEIKTSHSCYVPHITSL